MKISTLVLAVEDDFERLTPHAKLRSVFRVASPLVASESLPQHLFASSGNGGVQHERGL
jgi:hypothetical protein